MARPQWPQDRPYGRNAIDYSSMLERDAASTRIREMQTQLEHERADNALLHAKLNALAKTISKQMDEIQALRKKEESSVEGPTENLYQVFIVTKNRRVIGSSRVVVAPDENTARFEANVETNLRQYNLRPRDVTVVVQFIGKVAITPEPQRVQIVDTARTQLAAGLNDADLGS